MAMPAISLAPEQRFPVRRISFQHHRRRRQRLDKTNQPPNLIGSQGFEGRHLSAADSFRDHAKQVAVASARFEDPARQIGRLHPLGLPLCTLAISTVARSAREAEGPVTLRDCLRFARERILLGATHPRYQHRYQP